MVGTGASGDVESARDTGFIGFDGVHIFNDVNSVNGVIYVYVGYQLRLAAGLRAAGRELDTAAGVASFKFPL